jgi:PKHD-type hydroxylase
MHLEHSYYWFKEIISPEDCQKIIDHGLSTLENYKKNGISTSGVTYGGSEKQSKKEAIPLQDKTLQDIAEENKISTTEAEQSVYVRDSEVAWLNDKWLYDLILPYIHKANYETGWKFDIDEAEYFQFTVYHPGGFYGWHADGKSDHSGKLKRFIPGITPLNKNGRPPLTHTTNPNHVGKVRKISMTLNLNPPGEYDGGNLTFDFGPHAIKRYHECEEIKPQGSLIVFPSFIHHQVTPITRGTRYSLVLWSLGQPFK